MKNFDVNEILDSVHTALGGLNEDVQRSLAEAGIDIEGNRIRGARINAKSTDHSFPVSGQSQFMLSGLHGGDVSIVGHDEPVIRVHVHVHGFKPKDSDEVPFEADVTDSLVSLQPRGRYRGSSTDWQIAVPSDCRVSVKGANLDVDIRALDRGMELETVNGDIKVANVRGDSSISTVSGDIEASGLRGTLRLHTVSGDTTIQRSVLRNLTSQSVSGDLTLETQLAVEEQYLVSTTSGDVRLALMGDTGATVRLNTHSGDVATDLPTEILTSTRRVWEGRINGGGARFEMHSMSGDLRIVRSSAIVVEGEPEPPATAPMEELNGLDRVEAHGSEPEPVDEAATSQILAALERGDMSVDEAMQKLEAGGTAESGTFHEGTSHDR